MRGALRAAACLLALAVGQPVPVATARVDGVDGVVAQRRAAPVHAITVGGQGVALSPAFTPGTSRYAIGTTEATQGAVTVRATTSDRRGRVRVNGRVATGPVRVTGLAPGDEISVLVDDAGGAAAYSLVYLPAGFPRLAAVVDRPGAGDGEVLPDAR
ncbi:hypothetical protein [Nocardioides sp. TF02-7]|uniref:hypothetical protein n=1 Tax=Nocardioides sp. TF02-7 TaxID=2917724 RepID=UPI001F06F54E|nr:hypothetical protein [Nocardioides sp. TF02-7]UMG92162.1 hypothetical protein MF408_19865 [Nocardioides sp. TF02-7]